MNLDTPDARARIEAWFPSLPTDGYSITSKEAKKYNCIAWAAGKDNKWWEAAKYRGYYWPDGIARDGSTDAAKALYESLGYLECTGEFPEEGFERIAIYCDKDGYSHAARQLPNGKWTSKLGRYEDIEHNILASLCGDKDEYGKLFCIMKRKIQ